MSNKNNFLVTQAKELLENASELKQKSILQRLIENKGRLNSFPTEELRELIYCFPLSGAENGENYIDDLAADFPKVLFEFIFLPDSSPASAKNQATEINTALEARLSTNDKLAQDFLKFYSEKLFYSQQLKEDEPSIRIALSCLSSSALSRYTEQNKVDQEKWLNRNRFDGIRDFIFYLFGYGLWYITLFGGTNNRLAEQLEPILKSRDQNSQSAIKLAQLSEPATGLSINNNHFSSSTASSRKENLSVGSDESYEGGISAAFPTSPPQPPCTPQREYRPVRTPESTRRTFSPEEQPPPQDRSTTRISSIPCRLFNDNPRMGGTIGHTPPQNLEFIEITVDHRSDGPTSTTTIGLTPLH